MSEAATPVSVVLNKAADLLEEHGWCTGRWGLTDEGNPNGTICLEGAVLAALPKEELVYRSDDLNSLDLDMYDACPAGQAVDAYLQSQGAECGGYVWNDTRGRTADEVIDTLRAAAAVEAAKEAAVSA